MARLEQFDCHRDPSHVRELDFTSLKCCTLRSASPGFQFLLVFQAVQRPGNSFEPGRFYGLITEGTGAKGARLYTLQCIPDGLQCMGKGGSGIQSI